jgi:hypothetical protein
MEGQQIRRDENLTSQDTSHKDYQNYMIDEVEHMVKLTS